LTDVNQYRRRRASAGHVTSKPQVYNEHKLQDMATDFNLNKATTDLRNDKYGALGQNSCTSPS